jgi:hypothetical protein
MRQRPHHEIQVAAVNLFETDVRIENPDLMAFSDELLDNRDDGTFPQIVRVLLESQPISPWRVLRATAKQSRRTTPWWRRQTRRISGSSEPLGRASQSAEASGHRAMDTDKLPKVVVRVRVRLPGSALLQCANMRSHALFLPLLMAVGAGSLMGQSPTVGGCPALPHDNIWNARIDHLPVAAQSSAYVTTIGATKPARADFGAGLWNGGPIGIPFTSVAGNQPRVPVTFQWPAESDPGPYPIPPNPPIEGGAQSTGDRHVLIVDRDQCVLYELYAAYRNADGSWRAGSGARFDLRSNALRPAGWTSADAAGLPILPGLIRYEEVEAGEIRHALRFTAPQTAASYVWPARHKASNLTGTQYPPLGQRFRLKASFNISTFPPRVQIILRALKTYGMILADNGSSWYLSGAPDERWVNSELSQLKNLLGSNFEAVDSTSLMISPNSGQAAGPLRASLVLAAPLITGGSILPNNRVTLSGPAPAGGAQVALSSSHMAIASVPASVSIPAGAVSASFAITTSPVGAATSVTITPFYVGGDATASVLVEPGALTAVTLSAAASTGPATLAGTVLLSGPIAGGATVSLTSSNPTLVPVPPSVWVTSGALSAAFAVTVNSTSANATVTITARLGLVSRTAALSVQALPAPAILTFQQGSSGYSAGKSVTISNRYAGAWNGFNGTTYRGAYEYPDLSSADATALVRFEQLAIPAGKRITSATLVLTIVSWTTTNLTVAYLKNPWDADSTSLGWVRSGAATTWAAPGATAVGQDVLPGGSISIALKAGGEQVATIPLDAAVVSSWLANPATNQGLRISTTSPVSLYSIRHSTAAKRPALQIIVD